MEAIVFIKTPRPIILHEKYLVINKDCTLKIKALDCQLTSANAPSGMLSACNLPCPPFLSIEEQILYGSSVVFCLSSYTGLRIVTKPQWLHSKNSRLVPFKSKWQMELVKLWFIVISWIWVLRLSFRFRKRSSCVAISMSQSLWKGRNHASPKWKCWM